MQHPSNTLLSRSRALLPALALLTLPHSLLAEGLCDGLTQPECRSLASRNVFALLGNNVIAQIYGSKVIAIGKVGGDVEGNLIGIDFRPSQTNNSRNTSVGLYGVSDTGKIYNLDVGISGGGIPTLASSLTTPFDGGFQSLTDFNPVADALRIIGSNDQNFAVVNSNGNLNATLVQTAITYAAGDPQAGRDPNLTGGAYTNNVAGAATTIFYAVDYARDTLVTIADVTNGSSASGGGRLKTIGRIVDAEGRPINILPEAGMDIYTDQSIGNAAIISSGQKLYFLNLSNVNPSRPAGSTQNVIAKELGADVTQFVSLIQTSPGTFMDIAVSPVVVLPNPADLSLDFGLSLGGFTNGQPKTFEVTVTNQGPDSQNGVTFFSFGVPFKDPVVSPSQGSCTVGALNAFGRTFQCNLGTLGFNNSATVSFTVSRLADNSARATDLTMQFLARGPDGGLIILPGDPDATNNTVTGSIVVNR